MSGVQVTLDMGKVEELQRRLTPPEFKKVLDQAQRRTATKAKKEALGLVEAQYNLSGSENKQAVNVTQIRSGDGVGVLFKGRLLTIGRFVVGRGSPISVHIRNGVRSLPRAAFLAKVNKHKGNGGDELVFMREGKARYPIEALRTFAIPQGVSRDDNAETLADFCAKELETFVVAGVERRLFNH